MIWVTGARGLLGRDVVRVLGEAGLACMGTSREVDVADERAVEAFAQGKPIAWVINCAAYTNVDAAEADAEACFRVNRDGAATLASWAERHGAALIHVSTDYVFSGDQATPYHEDAPVSPVNVYGASKAEGEERVRRLCRRHYIVRTSWLYGSGSGNFVSTLVGRFNTGPSLSVPANQHGSPTWTMDLAKVIAALIRQNAGRWGTYHASGEGEATRYDQAREVLEAGTALGLVAPRHPGEVAALSASASSARAPRPVRAVLSKAKLNEVFGWAFPPWRASLEAFLETLPLHRPRAILVTGGAGFLGSHFIRHVFQDTAFAGTLVNLDKLTYAADASKLDALVAQLGDRYKFVRGDVADAAEVGAIFNRHSIDTVVHFAAESHVDRSIDDPTEFVRTNVTGTYTLLQAARQAWGTRTDVRFHQVSTDEVFGSLGADGRFTEDSPYDPHSPYSATKAAADHLVRSWSTTYGLPATISHSSNNFGPGQYPEKLIPRVLANLRAGLPVPVYGDGGQVRDWIHVDDNSAALWAIVTRGRPGQSYNVGGGNEKTNLELVRLLCRLEAQHQGRSAEDFLKLITFVNDRPGHDLRYALDTSKIRSELGWTPRGDFDAALASTLYKSV
jgi:dTDP-glucose 4,6-dehydratase